MGYYEGIGSLCCFRYMPTEFLINYNRDCIRNEVTDKEVFDIEGNVPFSSPLIVLSKGY